MIESFTFFALTLSGVQENIFLTFVSHYGKKYYLNHVKHIQASKPQPLVKEMNLNETLRCYEQWMVELSNLENVLLLVLL